MARREPGGASAYASFPRGEPGYPTGLAALADAPARVHVWGGALPEWWTAVAIVGSRAATQYGLAIADRLARDLAAHGVAVVSGLARGIDSAAHAGTPDAGDVLAALGGSPEGTTDPAARLRARLSTEPATVESLAAACGMDVPETLGRLLRMQWSGLAIPHPGGRWSSRPRA